MRIIGLTGTLGAGKGTTVEYLKGQSFAHYSARTFIIEEVKKRNRAINRDMTTRTADELRRERGPDYIARSLYERAREGGGDVIIESVRAVGELEFLRTKPDFYLIAIDADPKLRFERIRKRGSELDNVSYEEFREGEEREMHNSDRTRGNIAEVMRRADFRITNNTSRAELRAQIDDILKEINRRSKT